MPGSEYHVRAKSFGSRRRQHPSHLHIVPSNAAQDGSDYRKASYERQRPGRSAHSMATPLSTQQILLPTNNRSTSSKQNSYQSNDSASESRNYDSLNNNMIGIALGSPSETPLPALQSAGRDDSLECFQSAESIPTVRSGSIASLDKLETEKPRGTNWKTLGGLLGKKVRNVVTPPLPFYEVKPFQQTENLEQKDSQVHQSCKVTEAGRSSGFGYTSPGLNKHQSRPLPTMEPFEVEGGGSRRKISLRRILGEKRKAPFSKPTCPQLRMVPLLEEGSEKEPRLPPEDSTVTREPAIVKLNGDSLLEVEIPSVQLERFSIMFETLLQPQRQAVLSARTRGQLDELKSTNNSELKAKILTETRDLPLPGKTRSNSPAKSPTLSLFPPAPPSRDRSPFRKLPLDRSPLHRSATAIGLCHPYHSGSELKYEIPQSQEQNEVLSAVYTALEDLKALETSRRPKMADDPWRHSYTSTEASFHSASETQPIQITILPAANDQRFPERTTSVRKSQGLKSTQNSTKLPKGRDVPAARSQSVRVATSAVTGHHLGRRPFPGLQPLTLNPPTPTITQWEPEKRRYKSPNERRDPLPLPPLPHLRFNSSSEGLKKATEISVARQISFSHRQRELLVPIVPKAALQPMVIDVRDRSHTTRESQHLILEDA